MGAQPQLSLYSENCGLSCLGTRTSPHSGTMVWCILTSYCLLPGTILRGADGNWCSDDHSASLIFRDCFSYFAFPFS